MDEREDFRNRRMALRASKERIDEELAELESEQFRRERAADNLTHANRVERSAWLELACAFATAGHSVGDVLDCADRAQEHFTKKFPIDPRED